MRLVPVDDRIDRDQPVGVQVGMAAIVVVGDVVLPDGGGDARHLVKLARPGPEVRIVAQPLAVALEMRVIDRVEAHGAGEHPPVGLGQPVPGQVAVAGQHVVGPCHCLEDGADGLVIGLLPGGEARAIDPVVEVRINAVVHGLDGVAQVLGPVMRVIAGQRVEGAVEHADDLARFVGNDGVPLLVPEDRHRDLAGHVRLGAQVDVAQEPGPEQRVARGPVEVGREGPALVAHDRMNHRNPDMRRKALQFAEDQRPVRPRAGVGDVKVIAPAFRREAALPRRARRAVGRDPVAEARVLALVGAVLPARPDAALGPDPVHQLVHRLSLSRAAR